MWCLVGLGVVMRKRWKQLAVGALISLFMGAGSLFSVLTYAAAKPTPKDVVKKVAMDPTFIGLIVLSFIVVQGVAELLRKYGIVKSESDRTIERLGVTLNLLMGEDIPIQDTNFYKILTSLKAIDAKSDKEKHKEIKDLLTSLNAHLETNARLTRKMIRVQSFLAQKMLPDEWSEFERISEMVFSEDGKG